MAVRPGLADAQGSESLSALTHTFSQIETHSSHGGSDTIVVPDARLLFGGDYKQSGFDLILSKDGHDFTIHDYFRESRHVDLASPDGARLDAKVIDALTAGHIEYAQASGADTGVKVIGQVTKLTGSATAIRNGVAIELHVGDNVAKGDVVQAGAGAALVLTFVDGTVFGLSSNARMVLNEMVYDPNGSSNTALLSLVQGTITFVAGETARHGDMKVDTPVATMGIRGTAGLVVAGFDVTQANAPPVRFEILLEPGRVVGSYLLLDRRDHDHVYTAINRQGVAAFLDAFGNLTLRDSPPLTDAAKQIIVDTLSTYFPSYVPNFNDANPQSSPGSHGSPPYEPLGSPLGPIPQFFPGDQQLKFIPINVPGNTDNHDPFLFENPFVFDVKSSPTVSLAITPTVNVTEGGATRLNILAESDQNPPTVLISGAPAGTVLDDGHGHSATSDGSTPIDVTNWNLATLSVMPVSDHNFKLTVTATDGDTSASTTEQVTVDPTAPTVTWATATPGVQGAAITLGGLVATITSLAGDTNTLNTLTISGAPAGTVLDDGHGHHATSNGSTPISVVGWNLSTLTITPAGDRNFTLTATATEKDSDGDISSVTTATELVIVKPTAPTVTWAAATPGVEGAPIALGAL